MGWNDRLNHRELSTLPPEALYGWKPFDPFEPNDTWLKDADPIDQRIAMKEWFLDRFCDPVEETPYSSAEGGYIFIHGGPYDPADELHQRFSGVVNDDEIESLTRELHLEVGHEWAPVRDPYADPYEFDARFDLSFIDANEPLKRLKERLNKVRLVLTLNSDDEIDRFVQQLAFGAAISAMESFFYETVDYWVRNDEEVLKNIVTGIDVFKNQPIKLGKIFEEHDGLKERVRGYLQHLVWHQWKYVSPLLKQGLEIAPLSFKPFLGYIDKRHHIVHRSGHDENGNAIDVTKKEVEDLCNEIESFATDIDHKLESRLPPF